MTTQRGRPRNAAARERIVSTATELFEQKGYLGTTLVDIAGRAQVAVQTIYSAYSSKVGVLAAAHDVALAGDHEPVPLAERKWFLDLAEAPTAADAWRAALDAMHVSSARVAPLYAAMLAAEADGDVATLMHELRSQRARSSRLIVSQVAARPGGDRIDRERAADLVYALLSAENFLLLVTQCGWSVDQWREWVHDAVLSSLNLS